MKKDLTNKKDDLFDRIERYYKEDGTLDPESKKICERWELAFTLLLKHRNRKVAITKYMKVLECAKTPVSLNTAYNDFKKAELIFLPINKVSKDMQRMVLIQAIDNDIEELKGFQKHLDRNQHKVRQSYQDQINKLYDLRIKTGGLNQDDPNIPDFSNIQLPDIHVNVSPQIQTLFARLTKFGAIETSELMKMLTADAQTVDPEEDEETTENSNV